MKTWKNIELSDGIGVGITEEGYTFYETEVQGWNDEQDFSDLENLITIQAVKKGKGIEINQIFSHPDVKSNVTAIKLAKEAEQLLIDRNGN